jgi:hypothetical protein
VLLTSAEDFRGVRRAGRGCQFTSDGIGVVRRQGNKKPLRAYLDDARWFLLTDKIIGLPDHYFPLHFPLLQWCF